MKYVIKHYLHDRDKLETKIVSNKQYSWTESQFKKWIGNIYSQAIKDNAIRFNFVKESNIGRVIVTSENYSETWRIMILTED